MENKPASSLVVSLGKALDGTPLPLSGRQVVQLVKKDLVEGRASNRVGAALAESLCCVCVFTPPLPWDGGTA